MTRGKLEGYAAELPQNLRDADETLRLFGRWAMDRMIRRSCGSAERYWRPPPGDDDRQPREILMKMEDALRVQRALSRVPERERIILEILYVPRRWPIEAQLRVLRIPARLCRQRHADGMRMFDNIHRMLTMRAPDTESVTGQPEG
jgi:DNA-directed RNA polymerase specialized sigma24 family protein